MAQAAIARIRARVSVGQGAVAGIRAQYAPGDKGAVARIRARYTGTIVVDAGPDRTADPYELVYLEAESSPIVADVFVWSQDPADPVQVELGTEIPPDIPPPVGNGIYVTFKPPAYRNPAGSVVAYDCHMIVTATESGFDPVTDTCTVTVRAYGGSWERRSGVLVPQEILRFGDL